MANRWGNNGNSKRLFSWAPKSLPMVTAALKSKDACSLGGKLWQHSYDLDSILKSRDITLPTMICLVKAMVFPVVMYGCESWTIKKAEHQRIDAFELWCWRRLLSVPWTARRSNQSILKGISADYSRIDAEAVTPTLRPLMWRTDSLEKTPMLGKIEDKRRKGRQRMRRHHWLHGHEFEQAPGVGDGQGSLACCSPWGHKKSDTSVRLKWTES